jgi:hypothetical protein
MMFDVATMTHSNQQTLNIKQNKKTNTKNNASLTGTLLGAS